ncbi:MAG: DUF5666 domain-containing protein [Myxococcota bacterium]
MTKLDRIVAEEAVRSSEGAVASGRAVAQGHRPRASARLAWLVGSLGAAALAALSFACAASDSGGMSGTGISQGSINSFGSIFVNGVEWALEGASIELDGASASEADLRVGMVVRVEGNRSEDGRSGDARRVVFDDSIEGPIQSAPVETIPGVEKSFEVLGTTVLAHVTRTSFGGGATFAGLAEDDLVEISGFFDSAGAILATRIEGKGTATGNDRVELRGEVANLVKNVDGSGVFDLGTITIHYDDATRFDDVSPTSLAAGDFVEVEGLLRVTGDEVDATRLERESSGIGSDDRDEVDLEGIVVLCAESPDYCLLGIPVDDSGATFDPPGFMPTAGDRVECEGRIENGVLIATRIESENEEDNPRDVRIDAAVTSIDPIARTLVVLGVTIEADGDTLLEDDSDEDDENLSFSELRVGDFLEIEAASTGTSTARAISIEREDAEAGDDDVRLEGPVTAIDPDLPALEILGQPIPLDGSTVYRDGSGQSRTEEEFFRTPGDVQLGDVVRAKDDDASDLSLLGEADEVEIEGGDDDDDDS